MRDVVDGTRCPVCARNRRNPSPPDKPVPRARNPRPPSGPVPKPNDEGRRGNLDKILDEVTEILGSKEESVGFTLSSDKVTITQIGGHRGIHRRLGHQTIFASLFVCSLG